MERVVCVRFPDATCERYLLVGTSLPTHPVGHHVVRRGEYSGSFINLRQLQPIDEVERHMKGKLQWLLNESPSTISVTFPTVRVHYEYLPIEDKTIERTDKDIAADIAFVESLLMGLRG